jgi:hypothetical protein
MRNTVHRAWRIAALALLAVGSAAAARAQQSPWVIEARAAGRPATAPDGSPAELVKMAPGLADRLLDVSHDGVVLLAGWPLAAEERGVIELTRFDVYAPDARIVEARGDRLVEVPRSRLVFFRGVDAADPLTRLLVTVDPDNGSLTAVTNRQGEVHELRAGGTAGTYLVAPASSFTPDGEDEPTYSCNQQTTALDKLLLPSTAPGMIAPKAITSLHTATVAVDTDNELLSLKFGNNTTAATNYIANLIAAMNVMYERDLLVRLVQGFTILRPSTTPDPYTGGSGSADFAKLQEFSNYWAGGCGGACSGVQRALSMMLSGKQSSNNSASGIAWINGLCSTSIGYSFTQVFKFAQDTSANDSRIVGHELGHNFGSPHTHCYNPTVDACFNGESGCYAGATSCPAPATYNGVPNVRGTVMSYCHLLGGCSASSVFHTASVNLLAPIVQARVNQCIFPLGPPNAIFSNGFEAGLAPPWSAKVP